MVTIVPIIVTADLIPTLMTKFPKTPLDEQHRFPTVTLTGAFKINARLP